eukprot:3218821-Karenia_brevis.AAC.1
MAWALPIFPPTSSSVGCNACGRSECWSRNPRCPFFGRQRFQDPDAQLGDNVPHLSQADIRIFANDVLQMAGVSLKPNWWKTCRSLVVEIDG